MKIKIISIMVIMLFLSGSLNALGISLSKDNDHVEETVLTNNQYNIRIRGGLGVHIVVRGKQGAPYKVTTCKVTWKLGNYEKTHSGRPSVGPGMTNPARFTSSNFQGFGNPGSVTVKVTVGTQTRTATGTWRGLFVTGLF
jgi:hypothetical protein